jgi:hypothetical protein
MKRWEMPSLLAVVVEMHRNAHIKDKSPFRASVVEMSIVGDHYSRRTGGYSAPFISKLVRPIYLYLFSKLWVIALKEYLEPFTAAAATARSFTSSAQPATAITLSPTLPL